MKKLALALVFGVVSMGAVSAQTTKTKVNKSGTEVKVKQEAGKEGRGHNGKGMKSPGERAEHQTAKMAEELGLTADQAARVKDLNVQKAEKMIALKAKYGEDRKAMGADKKAIRNQYEADLKNVLSTEQYAAYQKQQEERKAKMKDKLKEKHGREKGQQKK